MGMISGCNSTLLIHCSGCGGNNFTCWVTPCPAVATRPRLTELYSVTGSLSLCNLPENAHCCHSGNNGCTILSISLADNENTVLALRGVSVGKAGNIEAVVLLDIAVTLCEMVADRTLELHNEMTELVGHTALALDSPVVDMVVV